MNRDIKARLLEKRKVDPNTNCWLWQGARYKNGYGYIRWNVTKWLVHRLSILVLGGATRLEKSDQVNHKRHCPNKHCFNPDHLYTGSQKDNMEDRWAGHEKLSRQEQNSKYYRKHNQHRQNCGR